MAILVTNIKTSLNQTQEDIFAAARKKARLRPEQVEGAHLAKTSVDARKKDHIMMVSSVLLLAKGDEEALVSRVHDPSVQIQHTEPTTFPKGSGKLTAPPVVVGFGPAGMFAALALAKEGYEPIVLEQGPAIEDRVTAVEDFWQKGILHPWGNVQFGEGGAGTFSDGKLTCRISDPRCSYIMEELIRHGAPEEIRYRQKPHIGTDHLRHVVKSIRQEIIRLGGQVRFNVRMTGLLLENGVIRGVSTTEGDMAASQVVLAVGHSSRETFEMLLQKQILMEPKAFSVGVRVEHPQKLINEGLYGKSAGHPALPVGEYQLSYRENGRGVYTFCMCPGGLVVPSSSEEQTIVTNGMSYYARDGVNANSAVVVSVDETDFAPYGSGPLAGVAFQRHLERKAFEMTGGCKAPAQTVPSYLGISGHALRDCTTRPSFACGVVEKDLNDLFPAAVNDMLHKGFASFDRKIKGFGGPEAVITGPETRTSSPVRIPRDGELQSLSVRGLYPCGEGAGYAGGIVSAAVDGVRIAQKIMEQYAPFH